MSIISLFESYGEEPTAADLAAIEAEWPQIAADIATLDSTDLDSLDAAIDALDAEIAERAASPYMSEIDRRRVRRAERRVLDSRRELADNNPKSEDAA